MPLPEFTISDVIAWEALDSRGQPTVACRVTLRGGAVGRAIVPAGASTGRYEALELRDGDERHGGRGVRRAVDVVRTVLGPAVLGMDATDALSIDVVLRGAEPPPGVAVIGSNATLAVSVATALGAAAARHVSLWRSLDGSADPLLPMPMIQILSGGVHAGRVIDLQDILIIPTGAETFAEAIEMASRVRRAAVVLAAERGPIAHLVGDEGGLALPFPSNRAAVEFVAKAIEEAGLIDDARIAIDVAANQLQLPDRRYRLDTEDRTLDAGEWIDELAAWAAGLPIASIEDPLGDDDWEGWREASARLGRVQIVGDDLFATDPVRLGRGIRENVANAVLVKPNQRGTLSEAADVMRSALGVGYRTIVSARSGETEDTWLADLAVGWRAGQIKVGSLTRSERTAKWNRLLEIESTESRAILARPFG